MAEATSTPASEQYEQTVTSIGASAELIASQARSIGETMDSLNAAFELITGDDERQSLGALGLAGVPLMATWRAMRSAAEQIVGQRTGQPLSEWLDFVDAASAQFDAYGRTLDRLSGWTRTRASSGETSPTDDDLTMLADVRVETQAWKVLLGQVASVGALVDAVLDSRNTAETEPERSTPKTTKSWRDGLKDLVPPAVIETVTSVGTSDIRDWLFRPLLDLRAQVEQLPGAVTAVAEEVSILEVKLDLAITQARSSLGRLAAGDVDVVELRVAGTVLVPALMDRLTAARADVETQQNRLTKLTELHGNGTVDAEVEARLRSQYSADLAAAEERLHEIEEDVAAWRAHGPDLVDRAGTWIDSELEYLRIRSMIEDDHDLDGRIAMLNAERRRLSDVARFLAHQ